MGVFSDSFQRPAGSVGSKWKVLVGHPQIYKNDGYSAVCPNVPFFNAYFVRYARPFTADTIDLGFSIIDRGLGTALISVCSASDAAAYLYAKFDSELGSGNKVTLGVGKNPDINLANTKLVDKTSVVTVTLPSNTPMQFRLKYNDASKKLSLHNGNSTTEYCAWTDSGNVAPHGRGFRYFGIGGRAGIFQSGLQIAGIDAV